MAINVNVTRWRGKQEEILSYSRGWKVLIEEMLISSNSFWFHPVPPDWSHLATVSYKFPVKKNDFRLHRFYEAMFKLTCDLNNDIVFLTNGQTRHMWIRTHGCNIYNHLLPLSLRSFTSSSPFVILVVNCIISAFPIYIYARVGQVITITHGCQGWGVSWIRAGCSAGPQFNKKRSRQRVQETTY